MKRIYLGVIILFWVPVVSPILIPCPSDAPGWCTCNRNAATNRKSISCQSIWAKSPPRMTSSEPWHELHFFSNGFTHIENGTFSKLQGVELLNFKNGKQRVLPEYSLDGLFTLTKLDFTRNQLYRIAAGAFAQTNLSELILESNNLYEISFEGLSNLDLLNIRNNHLSKLSGGTLLQITSLKCLNLGDNRITGLPEELRNLVELEHLDLSSNRLTMIPNGTFSGLSQLQFLNLAGNKLKIVSGSGFIGLRSLTYLNLRGTDLSNLPYGVFSDLDTIKELNLGNNRFQMIPEAVRNLSSLVTLHFGVNRLNILENDTFSIMDNLTNLYLPENRNVRIEQRAFCGIGDTLETLDLSAKGASFNDVCLLYSLKNLKQLHLINLHVRCVCKFKQIREMFANLTTHAICSYPPNLEGTPAWSVKNSDINETCTAENSCHDYCPEDTSVRPSVRPSAGELRSSVATPGEVPRNIIIGIVVVVGVMVLIFIIIVVVYYRLRSRKSGKQRYRAPGAELESLGDN